MFAGISFAFWRTLQILTLIPILGMLSYFVHGYVTSNILTPNYILVLFVTSVLAAVWVCLTLLFYNKTRRNAFLVGFVDLCFMATLIAAVVLLRGIANADCARFDSNATIYLNLGPFGAYGRTYNSPFSLNINKTCAMLKACFALAIMNILFFFFTFVLAFFYHKDDKHVVKETHVRRHGQRRSGSHRRQYY
ncbi:MAG: hypothetical protein M1814_005897 [Vezdaea aestivalis]|nr:MAG: hypothetical protein M1814_005897 [Vezdaea aestivalis]